MASPHHHAPKNHSRTWPFSSSSSSSSIEKKPHSSFFRIILPYILEEKKLKLPLKFVRRYRSEVSSTAKLALPNGLEWNVGVEKNMNEDGNKKEEIWFSDGWGEFMEHNSISEGFFLVFKYRGCSVFDVEIFDLTTCSISYPPPPPQESGFPNIVVISDDEEDDKFGGGDEMVNTLESLKASGIVTSYFFYMRISKMYSKCKKGIEDAILVSNPAYPSFMLVLNSDKSGDRYKPAIPISFAREHILKSADTTTTTTTTTSVVLRMSSEKKQWSVEVGNDRRVKSGSYYCVSFRQGWRRFKEDNNLGEGDVCLFQLISPEDLVMDVSIFAAQ